MLIPPNLAQAVRVDADRYAAAMRYGDRLASADEVFVRVGIPEAVRAHLQTSRALAYECGAECAMEVVAALWWTDRRAALVAVHWVLEALAEANAADPQGRRRELIDKIETLLDSGDDPT